MKGLPVRAAPRRRFESGARRAPVLLLTVAACAQASAGPGPSFDVRRVDVGFPTASVLVLDPEGEPRLDVVATGRDGVVVLRADATGTLELVETVGAGENPVDVAAGDLDEDGRVDLVVANHETRYVTFLFAGDDGFSGGRRATLPLDVSPHPHAVAVADIDEDGHLDVLVDDRAAEAIRPYLGAGDGTFHAASAIAVGGDPYRGMTLADVDGDGHLDILTPNPDAVALQMGDGAGRFTPGGELALERFRPFTVATPDLNGDGRLDVVAGSGEGAGGIAVWLQTAEGGFMADRASPYGIAAGPTASAVADVDGDGVDDVLVTSYLGDELAVLLGGTDRRRLVRIPLADRPWGVAAGDLDGDGDTDLVTGNDEGTRLTVLWARDEG